MLYMTKSNMKPEKYEINSPGGGTAIIADFKRGGEADAQPVAADGDPTEAPAHAEARGGRDGLGNSQHTQEACQGSEI